MLKLIAPFRAMLNLNSSLVAANQKNYIGFLEALSSDLADKKGKIRSRMKYQPDIEVNIARNNTSGEVDPRYVTIKSSGSFYTPPHIMSLSFNEKEYTDIRLIYQQAAELADKNTVPYSPHFEADLSTLAIYLHDNTIAILSLELAVNRENLDTAPAAWNALDEWTTSLVFYLLRGLYATHIYPLLAALMEFSVTNGYNVVRTKDNYTIFSDIHEDSNHSDPAQHYRLMWVNRTLCYFQDYPKNDWIKALVHSTNALQEAEVHINQGNCVIVLPPGYDRKKIKSFWDVMYPSQYYYAAMDVANMNLVKHIGLMLDGKSSRHLREMNNDMEDIINKVTLLQMRYQDLSTEMQGVTRKIFDVLQQEWYFPAMVSNVQKKLDLCKSNMALLHQMRIEKKLTGLVGIGIVILLIQLGFYLFH